VYDGRLGILILCGECVFRLGDSVRAEYGPQLDGAPDNDLGEVIVLCESW